MAQINEHTLILSNTDLDILLAAIANPPPPNEKLKQAYKQYIEMKRSNPELDEEK
jgi:uncharacterized protein (DUF1778 family)